MVSERNGWFLFGPLVVRNGAGDSPEQIKEEVLK
jgi:hypothetical protein